VDPIRTPNQREEGVLAAAVLETTTSPGWAERCWSVWSALWTLPLV
jgi:hypothetical protein